MLRAVSLALCLTFAAAAQSLPHFDAAAVKPAPSIAALRAAMASGTRPDLGIRVDRQHADFGFISLRDLIAYAYGVKAYQVDGPGWLDSERFDIQAALPAGASSNDVPRMLQALLQERFKLAAHRDNNAQPVYALVVAKSGLKMKPSPPPAPASGAPAPPAPGTRTIQTPGGPVRVRTRRGAGNSTTMSMSGGRGGPMTVTVSGGQMHMTAARMSMAQLAQSLTPMLDRPVVDQTRLSGNYQVTLDLSRQDLMTAARRALGGALPGAAAPPAAAGNLPAAPAGSSIFNSVNALGLRLEKRNQALGRVVVDHIEKNPTAN